MASKYHDLIDVSPEVEAYVDRSFKIADQIRQILRDKGMTQRELAELLGKKEPEISRMLSGTHNFTTRTLTRMEVKLGAKIMITPKEVQANVSALTVYGTVVSEEMITADWQPFFIAETLPAPPANKRINTHRIPKAAEESAAFFAELECVAC